MSTLEAPRGDFRVGRAITRAFGVLQRDFVKFFLIAAIITSPTLIVNLVIASMTRGAGPALLGGSLARNAPTPQFGAGTLWAVGLGSLGVLILLTMLTLIGQAVMLFGALQKMRSRDFGVGQSLKHGFARFFPILGAMILVGLALFLAVFASVLPFFVIARAMPPSSFGIIAGFLFGVLTLVGVAVIMFFFICMWFVTLPACVLERTGPIRSLSRSAFLTKGHRWRVFGLILLVLLVNLIAGG